MEDITNLKEQVSNVIIPDLANLIVEYTHDVDWYCGYKGLDIKDRSLKYLFGALQSQNPEFIIKALRSGFPPTLGNQKIYRTISKLITPLIETYDVGFVMKLFNISRYFNEQNHTTVDRTIMRNIVLSERLDLIHQTLHHKNDKYMIKFIAEQSPINFCVRVIKECPATDRYVIESDIAGAAVKVNRKNLITRLIDEGLTRPESILLKGMYLKSDSMIKLALQYDPSLNKLMTSYGYKLSD